MATNEADAKKESSAGKDAVVDDESMGRGDAPDSKGSIWGLTRRSVPSPDPVLPTAANAPDYNMDHASRGIAIIFNHKIFNSRLNLNERRGTDADRDKLKRLAEHIGFTKQNIYVFEDLDYTKIMEQLNFFAELDHTSSDCIFIAVSTHGDEGILYARDRKYPSDELWTRFSGDKCKSLVGKPKLFFIQACQGDRVDMGVNVEDRTDGSTKICRIPTRADFLIAYSTVPGYYSWRNVDAGSWFMQALCKVLSTRTPEMDLLSMMTEVNRTVAYDFTSNVPNNAGMHLKKQIPCITSMLTRKVYFKPKTHSPMKF